MLRFSVPPGPRRANLSAVYALFGVALVPVSILAIRLSERFIHPVAFDKGGPNKVGPNLWGVIMRAKASHAGFAYSSALQGKGGDWSYEESYKNEESGETACESRSAGDL
jgi:hypothetical protein